MKHLYIFFIFGGLFLLQSCNTADNSDHSQSVFTKKKESVSTSIDGKIFSIPSPYEFTHFIKENNIPFNQSITNPTNNRKKYNSSTKKCLNFGVYGVDLGYISVFDQTSSALNYFSTLKNLAEDINLGAVFNAHTIERLENNIHAKDSLLIILTRTYREADKFLKDENQKKNAVLILTGSWIESLYLLTQIYKEYPNEKIMQKIAEHKYFADNILSILKPYHKQSDEYKFLVEQITDLCYTFDGINVLYTYKKPIIYPEIKRTVIQSESSFDVYPEHIQTISKQIETIRNYIIK